MLAGCRTVEGIGDTTPHTLQTHAVIKHEHTPPPASPFLSSHTRTRGTAHTPWCPLIPPPPHPPQVIIERMDRLKPGILLTLKVSSVMGQWVDLDILHKFYPLHKVGGARGGLA